MTLTNEIEDIKYYADLVDTATKDESKRLLTKHLQLMVGALNIRLSEQLKDLDEK